MELKKITDEDGKTYILVPEEIYNEDKPKRARTGYERAKKGQFYYATNSCHRNRETDGSDDFVFFCDGFYCTDKQLAADNARADSILRRMRQWQALNDDAVERYSRDKAKYSIVWSCLFEVPFVKCLPGDTSVDNFEIYFSTIEKAREALEVFRDDLIWLHTQYRRRLDEVRE